MWRRLRRFGLRGFHVLYLYLVAGKASQICQILISASYEKIYSRTMHV
jgi:hypothetical protein